MQSALSAGRVSALRYLQEAAHPVVQSPEVARRQLGEELLPQQLLGDFSLVEENLLGDSAQQPAQGTRRFRLRHDPAPQRPPGACRERHVTQCAAHHVKLEKRRGILGDVVLKKTVFLF